MTQSARQRTSGVVLVPVLVVFLLVVAGFWTVFHPTWSPDSLKTAVLSEGDDDGNDNGGSGSSDSNSDSGSEDSDGNDDEQEARVEVEDLSGDRVRVRTRSEEGRERIDVYQNGTHLRLETRDGETRVSLEDEDEDEIGEIEIEGEDEVGFEVETATGEAEVRVRIQGNRFVLRQRNVEAQTSFPLSLDLTTNELIVTTPVGVRRVAVLPQQAIENMLRVGHVDVLVAPPTESPEPSPSGLPEASPEATVASQIVEIDEEDGEVVYIIRGAARERLLGLLEVFIPKTLTVSAQTGELANIRQTILSQILDLLSV